MKILILLLIPLFTYGQESNFQFQFGKTFFTSGDLWGNSFGCNYSRKIVKHLHLKLQLQNSRSLIKTEEVIPGFLNNNNQINSTKIILDLNQFAFKSRINIGLGYGLQLYQKYSNGGIRYLTDPNAAGKMQYAMESGNILKKASGVFYCDLNLKLYRTPYFSILGSFSVYKSKLNAEFLSSIKLSCPILKN